MRLLLTFCVPIILVTSQDQVEFVPIGKDAFTTTTESPERTLPKSVGRVVSTKVFTEDGIKYTEIVRKTPSGGTQVAHIKGDVKPSLLPSPVPNIPRIMQRLATVLAPRIEEPQRPIEPMIVRHNPSVEPIDGPIIRRPTEFAGPSVSQVYYPPPQYPPMMMYAYDGGPGLIDRVGSMTGNILGNVMDFVIGRRRR